MLDSADLNKTAVENDVAVLRCLADVYDMPEDGPTREVPELLRATSRTVSARLNSDYTFLLNHLPDLIPELTRAMLQSSGAYRCKIASMLVQAYRAADAIADKFGFLIYRVV